MKMYLVTNAKIPDARTWQRVLHERGFSITLLCSYHYIQKIPLDDWIQDQFDPPYPDIFLDSGAYSAMTQGVAISLDSYARYIQRYRNFLSVYSNLDVIRDAQKTLHNQMILEKEYGLAPLPVFHVGEDWSYLEQYLNQYSYIALGVAGTRAARYSSWVVKCFAMAKKTTRYHGFGITAYTMMRAFPWYSVDSTAWLEGKKFHHASLFNTKTGAFEEVFFGNPQSCYAKAPLLRQMGLSPLDFLDHETLSFEKLHQLGAISYLTAASWMTQYHKKGEKVAP